MSKHYSWQRQPFWPIALVVLAGLEIGIVAVIAAALAWQAGVS